MKLDARELADLDGRVLPAKSLARRPAVPPAPPAPAAPAPPPVVNVHPPSVTVEAPVINLPAQASSWTAEVIERDERGFIKRVRFAAAVAAEA